MALLIFFLCYVGIALGSIPGLALDRTGFALLGAIAMVACGVLGLGDALHAVDMPTILLLYGLMVVSAQFRLGGFYTWTALRISQSLDRPAYFLAVLMLVSAGLSAVLANDIVCLAFTPVLAVGLLRAGLNPVPFLLGLAVASNIGSAATIIGNPQNMLIGQVLKLDFGRFLLWCAPPSLIGLAGAYGILLWLYRGRLQGRGQRADSKSQIADGQAQIADGKSQIADGKTDGDLFEEGVGGKWPELNRWQTGKGLVVTGVVMILFFTSVPRELTALVAAGWLLCSRRMKSRSLLGLVDWHLITLFCGLFIVIAGLQATGLPAKAVESLAAHGCDLRNLYALSGVTVLLSNLVSNVPATMLLVKFADAAHPEQGYALALASTYAGNLITLGSIANLIVIEQAKQCGVRISFREHARVGIPVTLFTLLVLFVWIALFG